MNITYHNEDWQRLDAPQRRLYVERDTFLWVNDNWHIVLLKNGWYDKLL